MNLSDFHLWTDALGLAIIRALDTEEKEFYRLWRTVLFEEMKKLPVESDKGWRI